MATLTLRRAAVTYSRGPKGMKAWQLWLDWLTPAEHLERYISFPHHKLHATFFPMTPDRYISLSFRLGDGFGGYLASSSS